jgi:hypothetical protein
LLLAPKCRLKRIDDNAWHNDRNRAGCQLNGTNCRLVGRRENDLYFEVNKFGRLGGEQRCVEFAVAGFDGDILSFNMTKFT